MDKIEMLMSNPWAWLFLSFCTVISLIFAIYTWITGKKTKEISVDKYTNEIVKMGKSPIQKLEMKFDGKAIQDLSSTIYFIWNSGSDVINANDMVGEKPIRITCEGAQILDVKLIKQSDKSNSFRILNFDSTNIGMTFDYIDSGEGLKFQILHTGTDGGINVEYKIKGGKPKRNCAELRNESGIIKTIKAIVYEFIPITIWILSLFMVMLVGNIVGITGDDHNLAIFVISGFLAIILLLIFFKIKKVIKNVFHRSIPSALKNDN